MVKPSLDTADLESHAIPFPTVVPLGTTLDPREEGVFPEGGTAAWLSLLGCFCAWMAAFGLMNTTGTFQAYLEVHQLAVYSASDIGWIFGLYFFVAFVTGVQIGPIFDALGPRLLTAVGSVCLIACMFLLEACKQYYHFILVFSVLGGLGTSAVSTTAIGTIGHWFNTRRGFATGIASCGGAIGGVIYPLILSSLFTSGGFAWATRALGLVFAFLLLIANLFMRGRLPTKPLSKRNLLPDLRIFKDVTFSILCVSYFLIEMGLLAAMSYLVSFALSAGIDQHLSYQLIAIFSGGSFFGRWAPGILADKIGRFNTMILMIAQCAVSTLAFWLPAAFPSTPLSSKKALLIIYALTFGFSSGSNITLGPVCAGQLCKTQDYGRYFATCYTVVGIGALVGIPIAGQIVPANGGSYLGLMILTAAWYVGGLGFFIWARIRAVGWSWGKESI